MFNSRLRTLGAPPSGPSELARAVARLGGLLLLVALVAPPGDWSGRAEVAILLPKDAEIAFADTQSPEDPILLGNHRIGDALWTNAPELVVDGVSILAELTAMKRAIRVLELRDSPGESCLDLLQRGFHTSGMYWIRPFNFSGSAELVYCDQDNYGGGWAHIASFSQEFLETVPEEEHLSHLYGTDALNVDQLNGNYSTIPRNARYSRGFMNALGASSSTRAFLVRTYSPPSDTGCVSPGAKERVYIQQRLGLATLPGYNPWTVHESLYNVFVWSDSKEGGVKVHALPSDQYIAARDPVWDEASSRVTGGLGYGNPVHSGDSTATVNYPGSDAYSGLGYGTHGGLIADVDTGCSWYTTLDPTHEAWIDGAAGTRNFHKKATVMFK